MQLDVEGSDHATVIAPRGQFAGLRAAWATLLRRLNLKNADSEYSKTGAADGNAIVEFAIVAPVFLMLILACMEFAFIFNVQMSLQNAVRTAGRYAITGNHLADPLHPGQTLSRASSITKVAQQAACGIDVSGVAISSTLGGSGNAGGPGDTVTISVTSAVPIVAPLVAQFFKNGQYTATAKVTFRNEPFPPSNTL